jgi:hypothetical protein
MKRPTPRHGLYLRTIESRSTVGPGHGPILLADCVLVGSDCVSNPLRNPFPSIHSCQEWREFGRKESRVGQGGVFHPVGSDIFDRKRRSWDEAGEVLALEKRESSTFDMYDRPVCRS